MFFLSFWIDVSLGIVSIFYGIGNGFFLCELLAFIGPQFPDDSKHLIREIRSNGRPGLLSLNNKLNKLGLVLPVNVKWKPIVQVLPADSPAMCDTFRRV